METEFQSPDQIDVDAATATAPTGVEVQAGITQAVAALIACVLRVRDPVGAPGAGVGAPVHPVVPLPAGGAGSRRLTLSPSRGISAKARSRGRSGRCWAKCATGTPASSGLGMDITPWMWRWD